MEEVWSGASLPTLLKDQVLAWLGFFLSLFYYYQCGRSLIGLVPKSVPHFTLFHNIYQKVPHLLSNSMFNPCFKFLSMSPDPRIPWFQRHAWTSHNALPLKELVRRCPDPSQVNNAQVNHCFSTFKINKFKWTLFLSLLTRRIMNHGQTRSNVTHTNTKAQVIHITTSHAYFK